MCVVELDGDDVPDAVGEPAAAARRRGWRGARPFRRPKPKHRERRQGGDGKRGEDQPCARLHESSPLCRTLYWTARIYRLTKPMRSYICSSVGAEASAALSAPRASIASSSGTASPVATDMISSRFEMPGFSSGAWRTSVPESVTAVLNLRRISSGG